ncbi:MAG: hypothetical protein B6D41_09115 [Chloroflexi bacterium UTCFX4]|jgi:PIN domain nuclease of toxin-antitoxin system|nr:MAG: hypothetical protein B6D41_09115 [Chloroflexi bacterium UTCFX4]
MKEYVTDTHALIWFLARDKRLSQRVAQIFSDAKQGRAFILVPSIVLVELVFLLQRRRVPDSVLRQAFELSEDLGADIRVIPLDLAVAREVASFGPAAIPEMADRIVAATARVLQVPVLTADSEIAASKLVEVIW